MDAVVVSVYLLFWLMMISRYVSIRIIKHIKYVPMYVFYVKLCFVLGMIPYFLIFRPVSFLRLSYTKAFYSVLI